MKVKCISTKCQHSTSAYAYITLDKEYEVLGDSDGYFNIMNSANQQHWYPKRCFETVHETIEVGDTISINAVVSRIVDDLVYVKSQHLRMTIEASFPKNQVKLIKKAIKPLEVNDGVSVTGTLIVGTIKAIVDGFAWVSLGGDRPVTYPLNQLQKV